MGHGASITGVERFFDSSEIIVSKTDTAGKITYANDVFLDIAGFTEDEVLGKPHSIVRHPDMPRCVFKLLWDTIQTGNELFAYVVNRAKNGDHYWVFAHVTPIFGPDGAITGYHSSRRVPKREAVDLVRGLYADLCKVEQSHSDRKAGLQASTDMLAGILKDKNISYEEFVFALETS